MTPGLAGILRTLRDPRLFFAEPVLAGGLVVKIKVIRLIFNV